MCNNCYHARGRDKKAWKCPHNDKAHYALGFCQNCYQNSYLKNRKIYEDEQISTDKNEIENNEIIINFNKDSPKSSNSR